MIYNDQFQRNEEETIDLKAYLYRLLRFWYIFPICLLLGLIISYVVIKTTSPVYRTGSSILIKDEQTLMDPDAIIQSVVSPYSSMAEYKIKNEIEILGSYSLTERTIKELNFNVSYFEKEKFRINEIYKNTPFILEYDSSHIQLAEVDFYIQKLNNGKFHIWTSADEVLAYLYQKNKITEVLQDVAINDTIPGGDYFTGTYHKFKIKEISAIDNDKIYLFRFRTLESLINEFQHKQIEGIKYSSIVKIVYDGENISKSIDFLNQLINVYLNRGVEKKNRIAINTIEFINSQINSISDSLKSAENNLEKFKSSQKVMNIDFQSQQSYQNLESLQTQKAEIILKQKYYTYLKEYLSENKDFQDIIAPSSMGISDALLNNLIIELNNLYSEKVDVMVNSKKDNPYLESVKLKIENQKNTLLENILNSIERAEMSLNDINERIDKLTTDVKSLPETQRKLFTYEREFQLQDALYTFLLRKKSELQIAKASNFPENEIIDHPKLIKNDPVSPNKRVIILLGIIIGLGLPACTILLYDYFNDKITDISDVEKITDKSILGNIVHNKENIPLVLFESPNSIIAESFRSLRTNFQYVLGDIKNPVIMVTSTIMEEGKSFVSINLATSFALYQKKVVLLSFDLRRPSVSKLMELHKEKGLSTFLSGNCKIDDIIFETRIPNLSVIPTGPIPPNPSELIASAKTKILFEELRTIFDYIILDTPPIGIVSDALLLEKFADRTVFIIRHNYSRKKMITHLFSSLEKKNMKNFSLIINDINISNKRYNYGYNYNYNYNY
ncbi:MAG: hypothetical protein A2X13_02625 [Bacteroidetes bacterium GWC2_33_15]|nr:MAG: hypothetical protein A2X10_15070 [Bacteroidetes bacterium GWA2_33_15]OFX49384.1 MAG: hypothetical protein A2X13_02625 [Bacteroidetes bacterium GWC2_33_15]OFX63023.1 MAG: hypothetical protein A2X15_10250 [Bacteroidetes bacterium GWB2_32_14]OFX68732.1 MAG: hypothetical protein A2X14_14150 [Bacteroidetes bacterium GWD2_33_33]HAN19096.1 hypothetical protein [Bacteroidales bacterium]